MLQKSLNGTLCRGCHLEIMEWFSSSLQGPKLEVTVQLGTFLSMFFRSLETSLHSQRSVW